MKKGIQLDVRLLISGEADPESDWVAYTLQAAQTMIGAGAAQYPDLQVVIKRITENTNYEDDDFSLSDFASPPAGTQPPLSPSDLERPTP
jgi:hypothetical protein